CFATNHPSPTRVWIISDLRIEVKRGRAKVKHSGLLFTCLEVAHSLDTDLCITVFLDCLHTFFESMPRFLKTLNTKPLTQNAKPFISPAKCNFAFKTVLCHL